uniref:Uncharacterized protein n=1 Tax=Oryzias sinensis TaxID=183150 RepID=A0A8C7Y9A9_9TELE
QPGVAHVSLSHDSKVSSCFQSWISKVIKKRVCTTFIADASSNGRVCQCGSTLEGHDPVAAANVSGAAAALQWDSLQHSSEQPTDAFGEVEFPGAGCRHSLVSLCSSHRHSEMSERGRLQGETLALGQHAVTQQGVTTPDVVFIPLLHDPLYY